MEEVDGRLREAKAERRETDRDRKSAEAVAHLKRSIPGEDSAIPSLIFWSNRHKAAE